MGPDSFMYASELLHRSIIKICAGFSEVFEQSRIHPEGRVNIRKFQKIYSILRQWIVL